jgi:RNA polymerase sigma-70 factor, ECF subfamily
MATERDKIYWQWLAVRLRQGDLTAAEELIAQFQKPLLFYLRRLLQSEDDAWDCSQETWISALRGIRRLRKPEVIASFIYRVARNSALVCLRRRKVVFTFCDDEEAVSSCSEETTFTSHDAAEIREALDRLPHVQREVLTLFFLNDLSIQEISEVLEVPSGTVKSRLFHSKSAIRKILTEMGYSHEH